MSEKIRFGIPMPEFRTDFGTLRTRELEKIVNFINRRGILISECFERKVILVHPDIVKSVQTEMVRAGFQLLLIGATVSNLRKYEKFTLAQNRVLEALTPGALIINRGDENKAISVAVPDNLDLRDICSSYDGEMRVFITKTSVNENELIESLNRLKVDEVDFNKIGIIEYPYFDEKIADKTATVVQIFGPNNIKIEKEGVYDFDTVKQSTIELSQYEMGEWT